MKEEGWKKTKTKGTGEEGRDLEEATIIQIDNPGPILNLYGTTWSGGIKLMGKGNRMNKGHREEPKIRPGVSLTSQLPIQKPAQKAESKELTGGKGGAGKGTTRGATAFEGRGDFEVGSGNCDSNKRKNKKGNGRGRKTGWRRDAPRRGEAEVSRMGARGYHNLRPSKVPGGKKV